MKSNELQVAGDAAADLAILQRSLEGERFGVAAYDVAIGSGLLEPAVVSIAEQFRSHHDEHANCLIEAIRHAGGTPLAARTWEEMASEHPPPPMQSQEDVLRYAASLEASAASADVVALSELEDAGRRTLVARIAGVETMHWAVLRSAVDEDPVPVALVPIPD